MSTVPPESEWSVADQAFDVWDLGDQASPAYAMIVSGWVRLALRPVDNTSPPDWDTARERLQDILDQRTPTPEGWSIVPVLEREAEVIEIGPNAPPLTNQPGSAHRDAQVWRVDCQGNMAAWLIAYKDTYDATLVMSSSRAADTAWRSVARGVATQTLLKELPARSRWRLTIVGEKPQAEIHLDPTKVDDTEEPSPPAPQEADRWAALLALVRRAPLLTVLIVLVLCVAASIIYSQVRRSGPIVPALSLPGASNPSLKAGNKAIVVAPQMVQVRATPSPTGAVLMLTAAGQVVDLVSGPEQNDKQIWWQAKIGNVTGWLPEKLPDGATVLAPVPQ
ncbi:MAG: hypothetical protein U0641_07850 [Anaerolineae bacterium]